ncbi:MAG: SufS family cysteine desulfurase [Candidatus Roizmanbacteria bacterium]|nr:SufS family cysteine desulfurase [Candidatus Roizmanbacteria bacterium]
MLNPNTIRADFPLYQEYPHIAYLDSSATALKPRVVLDALDGYYRTYSANVFRGLYSLSERATAEYERAREVVAHFIGAPSSDTVIFTRNATESLNVLAYSLGKRIIQKGKRVVVSMAEHHANFVPWQQITQKNGAEFLVVPCDSDGRVQLHDEASIDKVVTKDTVLVALFWVSNVLGSVNDIAAITKKIKQKNPNTIVVVDAAQAVTTFPVNVAELGCDFLAFSGHKLFGPTGIGVLWGKKTILEEMEPFMYGGDMIERVSVTESTFAKLPHRFEAGTPHIAGAIGLAAAIEYITKVGVKNAHQHTQKMIKQALAGLARFKHIRILGSLDPSKRVGLVSFVHDRIHPHDLGDILSQDDVCVRAGHHCAMPLHTHEGIVASTRASTSIYTTTDDIERLLVGIEKAEKILV